MLNEFAKVKLQYADEESEEEQNIFLTCLNAEQTPASLDDYRQKTVYLMKLDPVSCTKYFSNKKCPDEFDFSDVSVI